MDTQSQPTTESAAVPVAAPSPHNVVVKAFGIGDAGIAIIERLIGSGLPAAAFVALNVDSRGLAESSAGEKVALDGGRVRGLSPGGDPERTRALAEEQAARLKGLCEGADVIFLVAGLGGGTASGVSPVLARVAKETGALVLAFVITPFQIEGNRRQHLAQHTLADLQTAADGVICLPAQKACQSIDPDTSFLQTLKIAGDLLADGVLGIWRLLLYRGPIEIHFPEVCELVRNRHAESAFAVAEAGGSNRSREVVQKLLAHPLLDDGNVLTESDAVLVSLLAGPDLKLAEIHHVMEQVNGKCRQAQVIMGAATSDEFADRLAVCIIAARAGSPPPESAPAPRAQAEEFDTQLLPRGNTPRPGSRFVPPPPDLPPEQVQQLLSRQTGQSRARKQAGRMRQAQLPLEIVSKGRFDKSEPTIHKGQDLDVPTFIRLGIVLN